MKLVGVIRPIDMVRLAVSRLEWDALLGGVNWPIAVVTIKLEHWFGLISS